jgi:plasmid maintenance system antidote protein VapI
MSATMSDVLHSRVCAAPSIRRLARVAGLDPAVVSRFRSQRRTISLQTADRLAEALGLSLSASEGDAKPGA